MALFNSINSYRIQLTESFDFFAIAKALPFLKKMGVDLVYTSPFFQTPIDSNNPYEVISCEIVDQRYGGMKGFLSFIKSLKRNKMSYMIDIVANHMASSPENLWFNDILKNGSQSKYIDFFDFHFSDKNRRIILPYLSKSLRESINEGVVFFDEDTSTLVVNSKRLPVKKGSIDSNLKKLISNQHYELIDYHKANTKVNFRRFFDIHELIGLNMHLPKVFGAYHKQIFSWFDKGYIQGFRVDHPDGLLDPSSYFYALKKRCKNAYIVAEKILQQDESIPKDWGIEGSVGYDYLNTLNQLFVNSSSVSSFDKIYKRFSGTSKSARALLVELKKSYMKKYLKAELDFFSQKIFEKSSLKVSKTDFYNALICFLANIEVYRSYVKQKGRVLKIDRAILETATKSLLLPFKRFFLEEFLTKPFRSLLLEIQEIMPAIFAKGFEDTFLYRYVRFTSLNEVGSSPMKFGISKAEYISFCQKKIKCEPYSMTTSSTHDTKRSEDVRQRLNVLSQMPKLFDSWLKKTQANFECLKLDSNKIDKPLRYLFYQTLLGVWPNKACNQKEKKILIERLVSYCIKASREAKFRNDWVNINTNYETQIKNFIEGLLNRANNSPFYKHLSSFVKVLAPLADKSSISSLLIRLTSCGVFDLYQGQELYKFNLVDPDNRGVVDFKKSHNVLDKVSRQMRLSKNRELLLNEYYLNLGDNRFRVWMLRTLLNFRKKHKDLLIHGSIKELTVHGKNSNSLIAFIRVFKNEALIIIAPRFLYHLEKQTLLVEVPFDFVGYDLLLMQKIKYKKGDKIEFSTNNIVKSIYIDCMSG